jgi:tetratricopeptide (TPR) repeat protein
MARRAAARLGGGRLPLGGVEEDPHPVQHLVTPADEVPGGGVEGGGWQAAQLHGRADLERDALPQRWLELVPEELEGRGERGGPEGQPGAMARRDEIAPGGGDRLGCALALEVEQRPARVGDHRAGAPVEERRGGELGDRLPHLAHVERPLPMTIEAERQQLEERAGGFVVLADVEPAERHPAQAAERAAALAAAPGGLRNQAAQPQLLSEIGQRGREAVGGGEHPGGDEPLAGVGQGDRQPETAAGGRGRQVLDEREGSLEQRPRFVRVPGLDQRPALLDLRLADLERAAAAASSRSEGSRVDRHLAGRAVIKQANLTAWSGDYRKALSLRLRGFDLLDPARDPQLPIVAVWNMLDTLTQLGHFRAARRLLWQSRVAVADVAEPHRIRWVEGRIYAGLADFPHAEAALQQARAGFTAQGQPYPAALVGLELAALLTRQGRYQEVFDLAQEMIVTFRSLRIAREGVAVLLVLQNACTRGNRRLLDVIEIAQSLLRDLERQPARPRTHSGPAPSPSPLSTSG